MQKFTRRMLDFVRNHTVLFLLTFFCILGTVFFGWILRSTYTAEMPAPVTSSISIPEGSIVMNASNTTFSKSKVVSLEEWQTLSNSPERPDRSTILVILEKNMNGDNYAVKFVFVQSDGVTYIATHPIRNLFADAEGFWSTDIVYSRGNDRLIFIPVVPQGARGGLWVMLVLCGFFSFFLLISCKQEW